MALLFMDGFDADDYANKLVVTIYGENYPGTVQTSTVTRFSSGKTLNTTATGINLPYGYCTVDAVIVPASTIFAGFAFNNLGSNNLTNFFEVLSDARTTTHLSLRQINLGSFGLYRGDNTLLGTANFTSSIWQYFEINATIADSNGVVTIRIDGVDVITYVGDTKNGGTSTAIDGLRMTAKTSVWNKSATCAFDDLYICDDTGTTNNTFLGDVRVQTLVPNAAGANTDFTPTGGTNYANVADIPDDTGTYNTSSTVGHKDTYDFSDLASGTGTVFGIQTNMHAKKADAGIGALKEIVVAGSTTYDGNTTQLPTSTAWVGQIRETNPDTSAAWTVGDVNSLEAGAEVA